jgi:hypothetical protein
MLYLRPSDEERYGAPLDVIDDYFDNQVVCRGFYVLGLLSDAQEACHYGDKEGARQMLNVAKYLLVKHYLPKDDEGRLL